MSNVYTQPGEMPINFSLQNIGTDGNQAMDKNQNQLYICIRISNFDRTFICICI